MYFALAAGLLTACGSGKEKTAEAPLKVKVTQAATITPDGNREFRFLSQPLTTSELSFRVGGPVNRFDVYAGNHYRRGTCIARIDDRDFRIRCERAEALYVQAKAEFARVEALYQKSNLAASTYEKARAECTAAKTAFATATNELADTRLIAPFDGYAGEVYIQKFEDVKAAQPVITFIDISQLKIEAYVTQEIAFASPRPTEVKLTFDAMPGQTFTARIEELSKSTTRNNLSYLLTALLPNADGKLLGGMSGTLRVQMPAASKTSTTVAPLIGVPQTALCERPTEGTFVWVMNAATRTVSRRTVTLGELLPNGQASIGSGLQAGETVVTSRLRFLSEGMKVEIVSPNATK